MNKKQVRTPGRVQRIAGTQIHSQNTISINVAKPGTLVWDPATNAWWYRGTDGVLYELSGGAGGVFPIDGGTY